MAGTRPTNPEQFALRERPRPVSRINRRVIGVGIAGLVVLMMLALHMGQQPRRPRASAPPDLPSGPAPEPADVLKGLPATYADVQPPTPSMALPPPRGIEPRATPAPGTAPASPPRATAPARQAPPRASGPDPAAETRKKALDEAEQARTSALFFPRQTGGRSPGEPTTTPPPAPPPAARPWLPPGLAGQPPEATEQRIEPGAAQNMQEEKRAFLQASADAETPTRLRHPLRDPLSPYEVKAGTIIPAVLLTGISSDLPGQIMAQVREQVYDTVTGQHLLIPQGTRLLGQYDSVIAFGQNRVLLVWERLIMPNGASLVLEGMPGVDLAGFAGLKDRVNHHWGRILGAVVLSSLFNIGARVPFGDPKPNQFFPTLGQEFARDAGEGINQAGQQIVSKTLNIQPTLTIRPGTSFNVFVHQDLVLRPYRHALARPRALQEEPPRP